MRKYIDIIESAMMDQNEDGFIEGDRISIKKNPGMIIGTIRYFMNDNDALIDLDIDFNQLMQMTQSFKPHPDGAVIPTNILCLNELDGFKSGDKVRYKNQSLGSPVLGTILYLGRSPHMNQSMYTNWALYTANIQSGIDEERFIDNSNTNKNLLMTDWHDGTLYVMHDLNDLAVYHS